METIHSHALGLAARIEAVVDGYFQENDLGEVDRATLNAMTPNMTEIATNILAFGSTAEFAIAA